MYDEAALRRKIAKEGVDKAILDLSTSNLSEDAKKELSSFHIYCNGYPNLSKIYSLA